MRDLDVRGDACSSSLVCSSFAFRVPVGQKDPRPTTRLRVVPEERRSYVGAFDPTVNWLESWSVFAPEFVHDLPEQAETDAWFPRSHDRSAPFAPALARRLSVPERHGEAIDEFEEAGRLDRNLLARAQDERAGIAQEAPEAVLHQFPPPAKRAWANSSILAQQRFIASPVQPLRLAHAERGPAE